VTGEPAPAPEEEDEAQEEGSASSRETPQPQAEEEDPFVEPKRPTYMLQHHPSQHNIKSADLNL